MVEGCSSTSRIHLHGVADCNPLGEAEAEAFVGGETCPQSPGGATGAFHATCCAARPNPQRNHLGKKDVGHGDHVSPSSDISARWDVGERLKNLADPKVGNTLSEALQTLRLWRRWLARAEELEVALPDGLVLLTVLNKIAEAVGKAGAQASFRISSVRQELQVDVRPHLAKIKQFSEYLQAEAEELSLATALQTSATTNAANPTQQAPGLKALATSGAKDPVAETGDQKKRSFGAPCRFWGTDGGRKKGSSCSYAHSWDGLEKNNRCFGCSGVGHSKRDCPVKKWDWGTSKTTAAAPPKVSKFEKQKDARSSGEGPGAGGEGARQAGSPGSAEEAGGHRSDSQHRTAEFGGHGWRNT